MLLAPCVVFMGWLTVHLVLGAFETTGVAAGRAWLSALIVGGLTVLFLWLFTGFARPWLRYLRQTRTKGLPDQQ